MNTGGNLGGIVATPIVAYYSGLHSWRMAFLIGAGFAVASAIAWLGIEVAEPREAAQRIDVDPVAASAYQPAAVLETSGRRTQ